MSQALALSEIQRFLTNSRPEVLSISGRWGVGKTYAWDETLKSMRAKAALRHYAYVSVFGLRSLEALKTAIVQSTVSLDGKELEPTVDSFVEHISSLDGARKLLGEGTRKSFNFLSKGAATLPYVGKLADLLAPGAALLIRNQFICIDDIERAGHGLDVTDILGLVSSFRERRGCKVVLLLNEDGLGDQTPKFREYLEKVVDQAIMFEPTPQESATAALGSGDKLGVLLGARTVALGITNIRVIRRVRRFLSYVEPLLENLHDTVIERVVGSIALLGWCVFEPKLAPDLDRVRRFNQFSGLFGEDKRDIEEKKADLIIRDYGFQHFEDLDAILLQGLQAGGFDNAALSAALKLLDGRARKNDVQAAIAHPWTIFRDSLADNAGEFTEALVQAIEKHAQEMDAGYVTSALEFLRELGRAEDADRLLPVYIAAQASKPREFFEARHGGFSQAINPAIAAAFEERLKEMPLAEDPAAILIEIGNTRSWGPAKIAFLASVSVDDYRAMLKRLKGNDLQVAISAALQFGDIHGIGDGEREVATRMAQAVRIVAEENPLNRMRLAPYLKDNQAPPVVQAPEEHLGIDDGHPAAPPPVDE